MWRSNARKLADQHLADKIEAAFRLAFLFDHIQELDISEIQVELADIITLLTGTVKEI
jgi:hypothetical protein